MAAPLTGDGVLALMPQEPVNPMDPSASSSASSSSFLENPILIFLFFQKAIRLELDRLHRAAVSLATDRGGDLRTLADRWRFISDIYKHHCNAEDEVIFSALDARVKNVACTYSLEHKGESDLFRHMSKLLKSNVQDDHSFWRELVCCTRAIQTSLGQHMSKEEEQPVSGRTVMLGDLMTADVKDEGRMELKFPSGKVLTENQICSYDTPEHPEWSYIVREDFRLDCKCNKVVVLHLNTGVFYGKMLFV